MSFYSGYLDVLRGMGKPSTLITATTLHTHQPIDQDYVDVSMSNFMAAMDAQPEPQDYDLTHFAKIDMTDEGWQLRVAH